VLRTAHREVVVAVARDGRVLFLRRTAGDDPADPDPWAGLWWLPGGTLLQGEDPSVGVRRLTAEETGWQIRGLRRLLKLSGHTPTSGTGEVTVYLAEAPDDEPDPSAAYDGWRWDPPGAFHDQDLEERWRLSPDFRSWMPLATTIIAAVEDSLPHEE
jgi:ADP-ribose pyrophosphatase YjhB (NUDIX family)